MMPRQEWDHFAAAVALIALALVVGCATLAPPRQTPVRRGTRVHLTATGAPLLVRWTGGGTAGDRGNCVATRIAGDLSRQVGDTIEFSWVAVLQAVTAGDPACIAQTPATATVIAAAEACRLEEERISPARTVIGFSAMTVAVGVTILLLVSVLDGIIDAVGRWF